MFNIWPYILRLAIAIYFLYPHGLALFEGMSDFQASIFMCIGDFIPITAAYIVWHSLFIILGILILIWPRPIMPLIIAIITLVAELYINVQTGFYSATNMLIFVLILVAFSLTIYHSSRSYM